MITPPVNLITHGIVAVAAAAGAWAYQGHRYESQLAELQLSYSKRDFTALEAQYAETVRYQRKADEAAKNAAARVRNLAADRDRLRLAADGLRGDIATSQHRLSTATDATRAEYAATVRAVLGECAGVVADLAAKADGHASDIRLMREASGQKMPADER